MADQQTGMEMSSSSSSSGDLCLLCLKNLAGSTDVDLEKLHLAAGMLQKLFQCYQIKVGIKDLPGCICDHCMAEVLKMCDNLRSWGEAQGRLQSQETGISDEEENEEEEEEGGHNESENVQEGLINEAEEEESEEDTVVDVESIDWATPIDSDYEALDDLLSEEYVDSPEIKYDPDSVAELDIDALVLANNGGILGKLVKDRTDMYCYYCHMVFHGGTKLRHHCIYDHSQLHYACFDCGETFLDANKLHKHQADKQHRKTVVNKQERDDDDDADGGGGAVTVAADDNDEESSQTLHYRCQKCGRIFDRVYSILRHERDVHRIPDSYKCKAADCHRAFDTKRGYSIHMKKHVKRLGSTVTMVKTEPTKPPPTSTSPTPGNIACPMKHCPKTFQTRAQLAYHKITHSGEEFYCIICSKRLSSRSNMRRHIRTVHNPLQQEQKKRRRQDVTCELEGIGDDDDIMLDLVEQQRKMDDVLQSDPDSQLPPLTSPAFIVIGNSSNRNNNLKNTKKLQGGQFISLK